MKERRLKIRLIGKCQRYLNLIGFKIDKKSLEFNTLRKRVIELKLLRYSHKKDFVSGKNTDLNEFLGRM